MVVLAPHPSLSQLYGRRCSGATAARLSSLVGRRSRFVVITAWLAASLAVVLAFRCRAVSSCRPALMLAPVVRAISVSYLAELPIAHMRRQLLLLQPPFVSSGLPLLDRRPGQDGSSAEEIQMAPGRGLASTLVSASMHAFAEPKTPETGAAQRLANWPTPGAGWQRRSPAVQTMYAQALGVGISIAGMRCEGPVLVTSCLPDSISSHASRRAQGQWPTAGPRINLINRERDGRLPRSPPVRRPSFDRIFSRAWFACRASAIVRGPVRGRDFLLSGSSTRRGGRRHTIPSQPSASPPSRGHPGISGRPASALKPRGKKACTGSRLYAAEGWCAGAPAGGGEQEWDAGCVSWAKQRAGRQWTAEWWEYCGRRCVSHPFGFMATSSPRQTLHWDLAPDIDR